jgi:hypothetical protein
VGQDCLKLSKPVGTKTQSYFAGFPRGREGPRGPPPPPPPLLLPRGSRSSQAENANSLLPSRELIQAKFKSAWTDVRIVNQFAMAPSGILPAAQLQAYKL